MSDRHVPSGDFADAMLSLINEWRAKPHDDKLTVSEAIGVLELVKYQIMQEEMDDE